jgi:hypothetical protein
MGAEDAGPRPAPAPPAICSHQLSKRSESGKSARTVELKRVKCRSLGELVNVGGPVGRNSFGLDKSLSQALIIVTKTYALPPEQDQPT